MHWTYSCLRSSRCSNLFCEKTNISSCYAWHIYFLIQLQHPHRPAPTTPLEFLCLSLFTHIHLCVRVLFPLTYRYTINSFNIAFLCMLLSKLRIINVGCFWKTNIVIYSTHVHRCFILMSKGTSNYICFSLCIRHIYLCVVLYKFVLLRHWRFNVLLF